MSSVVVPALEKRLPTRTSIAATPLNHLTRVDPFLQTLSSDLCDDGRLSARSALSFISRGATSAAVISASGVVAATSLAFGAPIVPLVVGGIALGILPPLMERATFGAAKAVYELIEAQRSTFGGRSTRFQTLRSIRF